MLGTYEYILKLHHVENEEYSIINILSLTCTSYSILSSYNCTRYPIKSILFNNAYIFTYLYSYF